MKDRPDHSMGHQHVVLTALIGVGSLISLNPANVETTTNDASSRLPAYQSDEQYVVNDCQ